MLMRFDPFREFDRLTQQAWGQQRSVLPMDAYRQGDQFTVRFDLPGVDPNSIDITVEKNTLTVRATRQWQRHEGTEVVVSERPQGTFTRQLFLSEGLDTEAIAANYEHGVLTVTIPVAERAKPRRVEIAVADGAGPKAVEANAVDTSAVDTSAVDTAVGASNHKAPAGSAA
jgi:HSP20 family protein